MSAKIKENETVKERVERLLGIDIYCQAKRPRAEVQRELQSLGIDTRELASKAIQITRDAVKRSKTSS